jgi:hypothetical protein
MSVAQPVIAKTLCRERTRNVSCESPIFPGHKTLEAATRGIEAADYEGARVRWECSANDGKSQ